MRLLAILVSLMPLVVPAYAQEAPEPRLFDTYWREAVIWHVVDGDTVDATIDLGHRERIDARFRLLGVNTPELNSRDPDTRVKAQQSKEFTEQWLTEMDAMNTLPLTWGDQEVRPFNVQSGKSDSFGRWLADVYCQRGMSLSQALLDSGNAVPFR